MNYKWTNVRLAGRIPELDGIRGLAILLVLILHYIVEGLGSSHSFAAQALRLSWSGVDLFFVLSGFLIGGILLDAKQSDAYYRTFYLRRISRILPLYGILMPFDCPGLVPIAP
jgi:peptidoglycan/LPS O-acetylase OafA/YrhL